MAEELTGMRLILRTFEQDDSISLSDLESNEIVFRRGDESSSRPHRIYCKLLDEDDDPATEYLYYADLTPVK